MAEWRRCGLYHPSINSKIAMRASIWVLKRHRSSSSHSRVAKKLSHMALSKQSPTEPTGLAATFAEGERGVLAALVGVMNHLGRTALPQCHVERLEHQLGAQIGLHRPAHDAPTEHIEHYCEIEKPRPSGDIRDIGDPQT